MRKLLLALLILLNATALRANDQPPLASDCEASDDQEAIYIQRVNPPKLWICTPSGWVDTTIIDDTAAALAVSCSGTDKVRAFNATTGAFTCAADEGAGGGEANTGSNLGGGLDNFSTKVGVDLRFNTFAAADFDLASNLLAIDDTKWAKDSELPTSFAIGGDGSGTTAALVVTDDSHAHGASTISALDAGDITTGTMATARLGSGTADSTKFLRGDQTWATAGGGSPCDAWPVGSVFLSVVSTNPGTLLGCGTWSAIAAGRALVGLDSGQTEFDTVEETGGAKTHTLTEAELPAHSHGVTDSGHTHLTQRYPTTTGGSSGFTFDTSMSGTLADNTLPTKSATTGVTINNTGSGAAHNNLQPYFVIYVWKRTA